MIKSHKSKSIKQFAAELSGEFSSLPITILPNGDIVYEQYLIKQHQKGYYELQSIQNYDIIFTFWMKSCALLAAHYYNLEDFNSYHEIQRLDRNYYKNSNDFALFSHCLKATKDFEQKVIFLNRLECSESQAAFFKRKISQLFKRTFV